MFHAIVKCQSPKHDNGTVIVSSSCELLLTFGLYMLPVVGYNVCHNPKTDECYYLLENLPRKLEVGSGVRIRIRILE